ncbi:phage portal protein [Arthrobacter sp. UYCu712]|uniref:phage portal protein n=1 Tax=Arthrobacter sp. UYCu712 TaxID=3156340 RepID=UPI003394E530
MDLIQAKAKTEQLSRELQARRPQIAKRIKYFKGESGKLHFASDKFAEYFEKQYAGFSDNWCMPVAQAPAERMNFLGIRPYGRSTGVDRDLERAWLSNDGDAGSSEAFLLFGVASRSYSLVHPASGPDGIPRLTWEHPESAIVDADPATGLDRFGLVVWADDKMDYATLYTPDQVFKFKKETSQDRHEREGQAVDLAAGWMLRDEKIEVEVNPLGEVPLSELRNQTLLDDEPISDIDGVGALQDSVNLIWAYLLNALDQASLPARVVTGAELPKVPILASDGSIAGYRDVELDELMKERILWIPGKEAKIEEWTAASLDVFSKVIGQLVEHIAAQTRTPPHYLVAKMVNTAAESLNIAEAGLVSKTSERITYAGRGIKKTKRLMAKAMGADARRITAINAGKLIWANVQYRSDSQMADVAVKFRGAGFPMEYIAEKILVDPAEVSRVMKMIKAEQAADPLRAAQRAMQQGM